MQGFLSLFFVRLSCVFSLSGPLPGEDMVALGTRSPRVELGTLLWVRAVGACAHSLQCGCAVQGTGLVSVSLSVEGSPSMLDLFIVWFMTCLQSCLVLELLGKSESKC